MVLLVALAAARGSVKAPCRRRRPLRRYCRRRGISRLADRDTAGACGAVALRRPVSGLAARATSVSKSIVCGSQVGSLKTTLRECETEMPNGCGPASAPQTDSLPGDKPGKIALPVRGLEAPA